MTRPKPAGLTVAEQQYPLAPSVLDASVYSDPDRYRRELAHVLFEGWYPVLPSSDVAEPRDYAVWDRLDQSVVVVRRDDGTVTAWHNVCQHRGARLLEGSGSCERGRFTCPWHGFGYDLDGAVTAVPLRATFDPAELDGLRAPRVRTREWANWVWLTLSDTAPDLLEHLGDIGTELAGYDLDRFEVRYRTTVRLRANWKLVVDSFNETWHVPFTHQDTLSELVRWRDAALKITSPHSWMTLPINGFTDRAGDVADHRKSHLCHYLAFPNTIFSCFPTHLQMWSAWPVGPEETVLDAYHMAGPPPAGMDADRWSRHNERNWKHFLEVLDEDASVINGFGTVARSRGFRKVMFNTAESRLTAFHAEVAARLRRAEQEQEGR